MTVSRTDAESMPGKVVWDRVIPKMEYQGLKIKTGQVVRVIDLEGEPSVHRSATPATTSGRNPCG